MHEQKVLPPINRPSLDPTTPTAHRSDQLIALVGGIANGIILLFLNISMASLVYPGSLGELQARGVGLILLGAAILALVTALTSNFVSTIAAPQAATVVIAGTMASGIIATAPPDISDQALLVTIIVAIIVSSLVAGGVLYLLGATGLGRIVRFLPYPVVGGFIAGVGWLFISGALGLSTGIPLAFDTLMALLSPASMVRWLPAALVGTILVGGRRWWNPLLLFPVTLIGAVLLFHLVLALTGTTLTVAARDGWVLGPFTAGNLLQPLSLAELGLVYWASIASQILNILTMPLIAAIVMILYLSGIEISIKRDLDLNRELRAGGLGTLAGGVFGGVTGFHLLALSVLMHRMGVRSRLGSVVAASVVALPLLFDAAVLNLLPRFVLGGLLIYFGYTFLYEWLVTQRYRMSQLDYGIVLLIVVVIAVYGLLPGVGVGLVAALVLFAIQYSRVRVVRQVQTGAVRRSRVTRAEAERRLLEVAGNRVIIFELQGYIFFGSATTVLDTLQAQLASHPTSEPRYVILDFRGVTGLDSSGLYVFSRLQQQSSNWGITVLLSGMSAAMRQQLDAARLVGSTGPLRYADSLDRALEWCEEQLLGSLVQRQATPTLVEQLADVLPDPDQARQLMTYLERHETAAGERLLRQGEAANDLFFIESGAVTAQIERPGAPATRLQTSVGGTVVGEIGFYLHAPRTSDVVCDEACVVYRLSTEALGRMREEQPALASALHAHLARRMAERLNHTVKALDVALGG